MKKYSKPITKFVELQLMGSCMDTFRFGGGSDGTDVSASRSGGHDRVWDDEEEEEENLGGWFQ